MPIYSIFGDLEKRNKKALEGKSFVCPECKKEFPFSKLQISIVSAGYDYLCPDDGCWIMVAEDIADGKYKNMKG